MAGVSVCLFSVAAHSVSLTTHFDLTPFHAVMVHFGNIHHEQREIPQGVILLLFPRGVSAVCLSACAPSMFVYVCRCARMCQRAFTKGSALGVLMHLCSRERAKGMEVI